MSGRGGRKGYCPVRVVLRYTRHAVNLKPITWIPAAVAATALTVATILSASPVNARPLPQGAAAAPDDEGPALFARMCGECHDSKRIVAKRRTSPEWENTLKNMIEEGAEGTEKDFEGVFNYLVRSFGKVFINSAKSAEIRAVLGLSAEQADAVVAYRTANGPFTDIESIKKVPGIDARKLDELVEAVAF